MANTVSAKKMVRKINRRTEINKSRKSNMRTLIKNIDLAVAEGNKEKAQEALKVAQPAIMKAANKGLIHKNAASRKVSRLSKKVAAIATA